MFFDHTTRRPEAVHTDQETPKPKPKPVYPTLRERRAATASSGTSGNRLTGGLPIYVTADEAHRALDLLKDRPREHALLRVFWEWGPRRGEALCTRVRDVDFEQAHVRLITLKKRPAPGSGPPRRIIPCTPGLLDELRALIESRNLGPDDLLFSWHESRCHEIVRNALLDAGCERRKCNCRAMRHAFAVNCIQQNVPLNVLQRLMGHSSAMITSVYIQVLGKDVSEYYERIRW